ncbi:MAG: glycogen debranching protein [Saprospiraceae bacterium]|nr:MAG: glycogen debranching protein [Saprospiraceae bacterium]
MLTFQNPSFEETTSKEWLVTNGIGGYASGTLSGANTRRYHGLLVASLNPPTQRQVLVVNMEECLTIHRDTCVGFSSNQFPGIVHPRGYQYLQSFERTPLPRMVSDVGGSQVAKTVFMVHGSNTTVMAYENVGQSAFQLSLTPFFSDRDYHSLLRENERSDFYFEKKKDVLKIFPHYGAAPLYVRYFNGEFKETRYWFKNFQYEKERYRGLDFQEDAYSIGKFTYTLGPGEKAHLVFSLDEEIVANNPDTLEAQELKRLKKLRPLGKTDPFVADLQIAAAQFVVWRASTESYSLLAGYHWFTDWGRDTMIAMRGLTIATGRQKVSRSILQTFFSSLSEGMLPNRFPDFAGEKVEYNTIDATLWLFVALWEYHRKFGDWAFIEENFDHLTDIIQWHLRGTRYGIHVTEEGFLYGGEGIAQLTWMDARIGDHVVTPRHGCPVEIQALWFNALKIYEALAKEVGTAGKEDLTDTCRHTAGRLAKNFKTHFWNEAGYLNDVVTPGFPTDESLRPNQIYAISLPFSLLEKEEEMLVFETVKKHLYTPFGLRTLDPAHPDFKPVYGGNQWERDMAYHQGTVWPFLLGDYFLAMLKLRNNTPETCQEIRNSLDQLRVHFYEKDCIHGISEIFDGLPDSYRDCDGRGTVQQAWSVGAMLMVYAAMGDSGDTF